MGIGRRMTQMGAWRGGDYVRFASYVQASLFASAVICLLPQAAFAMDQFVPPEGCETFMTTQNRSCQVENYYRCPAIAEDHQWRASFDAEGPRYVSRIDWQAQWVTSGPPEDPTRWATLTPVQDGMSVDTLFEEKRDDFAFHQRRVGQPFESFKGEDRITGETEIDGEPLFSTTYWLEVRDWQGNLIRTDTGEQYVSSRHRRYFGGRTLISFADGRELRIDNTPVEFIYPGEAGFAATSPVYDCGVMSRAESAQPIPAAYDVLAPLRAEEERD